MRAKCSMTFLLLAFALLAASALGTGCTDVERRFATPSEEAAPGPSGSATGGSDAHGSMGSGPANGSRGSGASGSGADGSGADGSGADGGSGASSRSDASSGDDVRVRLTWAGDDPGEGQVLVLDGHEGTLSLIAGEWVSLRAGTWELTTRTLELDREDGLLERYDVEEVTLQSPGASSIEGTTLHLEGGDLVEIDATLQLEWARVVLRMEGLVPTDECLWAELPTVDEESASSEDPGTWMSLDGAGGEPMGLFRCTEEQVLSLPPGPHELSQPLYIGGAAPSQIEALYDPAILNVELNSGDEVVLLLPWRDRGYLLADPGVAQLRSLILDADVRRLWFDPAIPDVVLPAFVIESTSLEIVLAGDTELILAAPLDEAPASIVVGQGASFLLSGGFLTHAFGLGRELLRVDGGSASLREVRVELAPDLVRPEAFTLMAGNLSLHDLTLHIELDSTLILGPPDVQGALEWLASGGGVVQALGGHLDVRDTNISLRSLPRSGSVFFAAESVMTLSDVHLDGSGGVWSTDASAPLALVSGRDARVSWERGGAQGVSLRGMAVLCSGCDFTGRDLVLESMSLGGGALAFFSGAAAGNPGPATTHLSALRTHDLLAPTLLAAAGLLHVEGSALIEEPVARTPQMPALILGDGDTLIEGSLLRFAPRTEVEPIALGNEDRLTDCLADTGGQDCDFNGPGTLSLAFTHVLLTGEAGSGLWNDGEITLYASVLQQRESGGPSTLLPCSRVDVPGLFSLGYNVLGSSGCLTRAANAPSDMQVDPPVTGNALASTAHSGVSSWLVPRQGQVLDGVVPASGCTSVRETRLLLASGEELQGEASCAPGALGLYVD